MAELYYIDGYNVIHKSSLLRPIARADFEAARAALADKVAVFCTGTGKRAVIVFDGRGRYREEAAPSPPGVSGLQVLYAPSELSADAVIERHVYQAQDRLNIVVVSNDRGLRDQCRHMGALTMEADHFIKSVRDVRRENEEAINRAPRDNKGAHIEDRISGDALEKLRQLRDRL